MSKVYITKANLQHIIQKSHTLKNLTRSEMQNYISDSDFEDSDDKEILDMYTNQELKDIYYMKYSLVESANFFNDVIEAQNKIKNSIDSQNLNLVFKIKNPSYHEDRDCKFLSAGFTNIELPKDYRNDDARHWVQQHQNSYQNFIELNTAFKKHFSTEEDLIEINRGNSGKESVENKLLSEMLDTTFLKTKVQLKMLFNPAVYNFIEKYKFVSKNTIDGLKEKEDSIQNIITEYYYAKEFMKKIILSKLQREYNADLAFDKSFLDNLGFKCCKGCSRH